MEIPGNDIRLRNKTVQDKIKINAKDDAKKSEGSSSPSSASPSSEKIALSSHALKIQKEIQLTQEVVNNAPEIRVEKVERIKIEIAEGRFQVDPDKLAENILREILNES